MRIFKKTMSIILVIVLAASVFVFPASASTTSKYYSDVYTSDPFCSAVNYLREHEIMFGTTDNTFSPQKELTRAQVVSILWRMLNEPEPSGTVQVFSDCQKGTYYKVLCSSEKDESSYSTNKYATRYWCLGSGYDYMTNPAVFTTLYADTNSDSRVSLNELYKYSHDKILASNLDQHVVCCPELDNFIIFESGY